MVGLEARRVGGERTRAKARGAKVRRITSASAALFGEEKKKNERRKKKRKREKGIRVF